MREMLFIFFTNFCRLPEDFWQTCALEFSSFQGYWLPEGILVLKMKNDSLNTIVQFRGIMHPRQLCWLPGAFAGNTKPHPFCGRCSYSFTVSPATLGWCVLAYSEGIPVPSLILAPEQCGWTCLLTSSGQYTFMRRCWGWLDGRTARWWLGSHSSEWQLYMALGTTICQGNGVPSASFISFKYSRESSPPQVRFISSLRSKKGLAAFVK